MSLTPDAQVPALSVPLVGGGTFTLADQTPEMFTMVVFYRGLHCPVCKAQLQTLQGLSKDFAQAGFSVLAVSMDTEEKATTVKQDWDLPDLNIGHSLDEATARAWGLYISHGLNPNEAPVFAEPGLFWVRPDGRLYLTVVSNMPWGRPDLGFLLSKVPLIIEKGYPARGV